MVDVNEVQRMIDSLGIKPSEDEIRQKQAEIERLNAEKEKALKARRLIYTKRYKEKYPEKVAEIRRRHYDKLIVAKPDYFREKTRESYIRRSAIKYECPCFSRLTKASLRAHLGTLKHQRYAAENPNAKYPWDEDQ